MAPVERGWVLRMCVAMIAMSDTFLPMPMCQVPDVAKVVTSDAATVIGEIDGLRQLNGGSDDVA